MDDRHETLMHQTLVLSGATPFAEMLHYAVALVDLSKLCTFLKEIQAPLIPRSIFLDLVKLSRERR